ncbi:DUF4159 domain-containing protein [Roseobacter sp. HKCCD9010]|uniref:DUF4159 domain-containing protein n=1 Tax=unclassified Roseobacter TaxID=196798 RepID=UPI001490D241|nr:MULTISPECIES: DUF4159 domain-containing protein [unclassified Roseobacter]MBF9048882.1 DUF4159 domain-containing protein [Rhodobacterales bacterium HKCCD4356]NNV10881.1 DUF4159 domain-containing protein [Roseobacter sp. HKCCD7357]NNV15066.1 DUF4159 domain-containing protein [Roseobacter sp. HKCCD8768]NNV24525.1 DUF4159 domain-containing protein [Roseobacter sp. HKCCD8192]NNV28782.1 DUF4159 domain-containing protein [Roseobacter sp. HKCCD9061]
MLSSLAFTTPLLLITLIVLPILWWLLRAVPPAPIRRRFPGVALLLGLRDDDSQSDKTPWWLLLLRMLAVAAAIIGFAGPVLNPEEDRPGEGPLLIAMDASWASAGDWQARLDRVGLLLDEAGRAGRPVALVRLGEHADGALPLQAANAWAQRVPNLAPRPYAPDMTAAVDWVDGLEGPLEVAWISDGVDRAGRGDLIDAFQDLGPLSVFQGARDVVALAPPRFEDGLIVIPAMRLGTTEPRDMPVAAFGLDPAGTPRELARDTLRFDGGEMAAELALSLPPELRNRITRFEMTGARSAGAVSLTDDSLQRREIALISGAPEREGQVLLSPLHFLREALEPTADLLEGALSDLLLASPDVIILADVAQLSPDEQEGVTAWVQDGGLLVRFAGPRLAASDIARAEMDPLLPVRLREGGRTVGGAMSWGEPKALRPFAEDSPFYGLPIPEDVNVTSQVLAQPDPMLSERTIAALADGTPLVTRTTLGQGGVVLFHVTANAEWSSLPLSGLFVQMLERLAISTRPVNPAAADLEGVTWVPEQVLDGFGVLRDAGARPGVSGADLAEAPLSAEILPGLYAGSERRVARNVIGPETVLAPAVWPRDVPVEGLSVVAPTDLMAAFLTAALALLMLDVLAALWLSGRLSGLARSAAVLALAFGLAPMAEAQQSVEDELALLATSEITLAYVETGNARMDDVSRAGLQGLSNTLWQRTSVEPAPPIGVNLETDELAFFPMLYWPISPDQPLPSAEAYARLNTYLRSGGMIVFDTRDADLGGFGAATPTGRRLRQLAAPLDIPPLEPIPSDHVLTRTFYLLQDFPGRHLNRDVWVEASPPDAEQIDGMPFRNLNDGVTPVVIGGNDWAAAWAVDASGRPLFPVGRGFTGERQREIAHRFGVNLVMHVLSGNYKSDQVHVPALLDRLGQ